MTMATFPSKSYNPVKKEHYRSISLTCNIFFTKFPPVQVRITQGRGLQLVNGNNEWGPYDMNGREGDMR